MFNFSANNLVWLKTIKYEKCNVHILKDSDTKRSYKIYDYSKNMEFNLEKVYCVSGKVNSADKLYLIAEKYKESKRP
ncbi:MAG TPA: hypothetical protein VFC79_05110 [Tissierellaceae bacterium]|nr:hypothetical protein [Tissierellaceae bacterium]